MASCCIHRHSAEVIRSRRIALNLNQEQFAALVGVDQTAVSYWEKGKGLPKLSTLKKLARLFEMTVDDLLGP